MDEVLIPVDYRSGNIIRDDELNKLIAQIPTKCKIFGLFDCCNSGTILDLKYLLKSPKNNSIENTTNSINTEQNIFMISGCKDNQTSADFFNSATNKFAGALTTAFLNTSTKLKHNNITFYTLLNNMRIYLKNNKFTQIPQICSNKKINEHTYYRKNNNLLVQYTPPPPPKPSKPSNSSKPSKPSKPNLLRRRFRNRYEYLMYIRYLRYVQYRRWLASRKRR